MIMLKISLYGAQNVGIKKKNCLKVKAVFFF